MAQCIYCKGTDSPFDREHVIPQAFGSYGADTMVLIDMVCHNCNSGLGADIDQILSRDSFEALIRQQSLPQRTSGSERFRPRRFRIYLRDEERYGIVRGAMLTIDWNTRSLRLLDQIIIRSSAGELHHFLAGEFPQADNPLLQNLPPGAIRIVGTDPAAVEALMETVRIRDIRLGDHQSVPPPRDLQREALTEIEGLIDRRVWRSIAKIAFNYLACIEGTRFVLNERFDPIRDFITGRQTKRAMVRLLTAPILRDESYNWRAFEGHLVVYQREDCSLKGKVSLYNSITYEVMLCADLGLYYPMKSGHAFDPVHQRVYRLTGIPFRIYRQANPMRQLFFFPLG